MIVWDLKTNQPIFEFNLGTQGLASEEDSIDQAISFSWYKLFYFLKIL